METSQENEDPKNWKNQNPLYLLDKETTNLWKIDKTKGFGLGVVHDEEVTREAKG